LRSKRRQIRPIVDLDRPDFSAIDARDQCVASFGVSSSVAAITSSTLSSRIDGGRPGRGSSVTPSNRLSTNRRRHLATVCSITRNSAATALFVAPGAAQAKMIRARNANACADFARRDHRVNCSRSPSESTNSALGRPGRARSLSPASRSRANRRRQTCTVIRDTPIFAATLSSDTPGSVHANTIRARSANRDEPRDHATSWSRSSPLNTNSTPRPTE
jgi:hypothetical protein